MYWSPRAKITFSNEELVQQLNATRACPERRGGNWWTFYSHLDQHEQARLLQAADKRWKQTGHFVPSATSDAGGHLHPGM